MVEMFLALCYTLHMWLKKLFFALPIILVATFFVAHPTFGDTIGMPATTTPAIRSASFDFGIKSPGILPISPLYFLKVWRRDMVRSITTDPFSEASLELSILNEKGAEVQGVMGFRPDDGRALAVSLDVYQNSVDRVKSAIENLFTVDVADVSPSFLSALSREMALHVSFLNTLGAEHSSDTQAGTRIMIARRGLEDIEKTALIRADTETLRGALAAIFPEGAPLPVATTIPVSAAEETLYRMALSAGETAATGTRDVITSFFAPAPAASSTDATSTLPGGNGAEATTRTSSTPDAATTTAPF